MIVPRGTPSFSKPLGDIDAIEQWYDGRAAPRRRTSPVATSGSE